MTDPKPPRPIEELIAEARSQVPFGQHHQLLRELADALEHQRNLHRIAVKAAEFQGRENAKLREEHAREEGLWNEQHRHQHDVNTRLAAEVERLREENAKLREERRIGLSYLMKLRDENRRQRRVVEAASSVLSEDGVKEHLSAYVMGVELIDRLAALDAGEGEGSIYMPRRVPNWFCCRCGGEGFNSRWPEFPEGEPGQGQEIFMLKSCDQHLEEP